MANRGRGGKSSSLTQEQLQAMGCIGKDMPQVQTAPPPTFPALMTKPVAMEMTASQNYQILWKEDFLTHMRDSPYYMVPKVTKMNIQRYSDQYVNALENSKTKTKADIPWLLMPTELCPVRRKRKNSARDHLNTKKPKATNIVDKLILLEEKEKTDIEGDIEDKKASDSEGDDEDEEETKVDDEMDEENDYGNSYFDNGEAYNEEDDNLDDGPVY